MSESDVEEDVVTGVERGDKDTSCTTEAGAVGECVQYYLCDSNNTIIADGVGIIDIRRIFMKRTPAACTTFRVRDGPCESYLETCCLLADKRPPENPITPAPDTNKPTRTGCGWRNPEGVGFRITGDVDGEAKFGEFPWMVAILNSTRRRNARRGQPLIAVTDSVAIADGPMAQRARSQAKIELVNENDPDSQKLNVYVGGGSLIHPSVVLTAAHYVHNSTNLRVRAGEWDTQTKNELHPFQDRNVVEVKVHKDFNSGTLYYDVAILFLKSPMTMAPNVGVVCLPPPSDQPRAGTRCLASGWGKDQFGKEGRYQVILKKVSRSSFMMCNACIGAASSATVTANGMTFLYAFTCPLRRRSVPFVDVPVVEHNSCQTQLRRTRLGRFFSLHSSFMCAGGEPGKDTCKGDGGSPLVCPIEYDPDRYQQNGIVAWGIGCGEGSIPGVYVDVAKVRSWIDDVVAAKNYDRSVYTA
ncbi:Phenoloxidase-activating factor 2 [Eumeta japonica]|uniref:Phenoloxidase-activating factor 2 n=1 Tax=Eumeta variegata TaxID=151549 RepID=A0A4C1V2U2_EUMVA|nr:Phenoloxidase-activating factor 2 [Eumeta japonica]